MSRPNSCWPPHTPWVTSHQPRRRAFSLVELLVVITIIGMLMALLIPAVNASRARARQLQCLNNLKQIGLAAQQYHNQRRVFPQGMHGRAPYRLSGWLTHLLPYVEQQALWARTEEAYKQSPLPFKNPPHVGLATLVPLGKYWLIPAVTRWI